eukprot:scaffold97693_cov61-Phaeocystis_antarctica.AAC.6
MPLLMAAEDSRCAVHGGHRSPRHAAAAACTMHIPCMYYYACTAMHVRPYLERAAGRQPPRRIVPRALRRGRRGGGPATIGATAARWRRGRSGRRRRRRAADLAEACLAEACHAGGGVGVGVRAWIRGSGCVSAARRLAVAAGVHGGGLGVCVCVCLCVCLPSPGVPLW